MADQHASPFDQYEHPQLRDVVEKPPAQEPEPERSEEFRILQARIEELEQDLANLRKQVNNMPTWGSYGR